MTALIDPTLTGMNLLQREKLFEKNRGLWDLSNLMLTQQAGTRPDRLQPDLAEPRPVPPGKENAPPSDGGVYRGTCPPVELTPSPDLSVRARQSLPKRDDPPRGYPGERAR
jgi:hypothetical protein